MLGPTTPCTGSGSRVWALRPSAELNSRKGTGTTMDRPGQREEDLPQGQGPPQLGFVQSLALRPSAAPHPGIFPRPPGRGWHAERSSLTGPPSLRKISKAPVNPTTQGSSNGWQSEEAVAMIQE